MRVIPFGLCVLTGLLSSLLFLIAAAIGSSTDAQLAWTRECALAAGKDRPIIVCGDFTSDDFPKETVAIALADQKIPLRCKGIRSYAPATIIRLECEKN